MEILSYSAPLLWLVNACVVVSTAFGDEPLNFGRDIRPILSDACFHCHGADAAQRKADLKDSAVWELERGLAMSAMEVHRASVIRSDWFLRAAALFEKYDALVLPAN